MPQIVLLDAGVIGLAISSPDLPLVLDCLHWLNTLVESNIETVVPDVTDFEVRRELFRIGANVKLQRLARLRMRLGTAHVTEQAWFKAAELWAFVRKAGLPTADPHALDADAILAAVALTIGGVGHQVVIATTNFVHLARFPGVDARSWNVIG